MGVPPGWAEVLVTDSVDGRFAYLARQPVKVLGEGVTDAGDIEVGQGATVKGRVVRTPGDKPVAGQSVKLYSPRASDVTQVTDSDGRFVFERLRGGQPGESWTLYLSDRGISSIAVPVPGDDGTVEITIRLTSARIRGTVTRGGVPEAATLVLSQVGVVSGCTRRLSSDISGRFEIADVPAGTYNITYYDSNALGALGKLEVPESGEVTRDIQLPTGAITGRVVAADGRPAAAVTVVAFGSGPASGKKGPNARTTDTGADGEFRFEKLVPGDYELAAMRQGGAISRTAKARVPESGNAAAVELRLPTETGTLAVMALDFESGDPIPNFRTEFRGELGLRVPVPPTSTKADGTQLTEGLAAGDYSVVVSAGGYNELEHKVTITAGKTESIIDVLEEAGTLRWIVAAPDGSTVAGIRLLLEPLDPNSVARPREGKTDEWGSWETTGILPGRYRATAFPADGAAVAEEVVIAPRRPAFLRMTVKR
jgi:hypothetical protein